MTIEQIIAKIKNQRQTLAITTVKKAYEFAVKAYGNKKQPNGEPYLQHNLHTAFILAQIGADTATIAAGLLHNITEETHYKLNTVKKQLGTDIAFLVDNVTKLNIINYHGQGRYRESLKKMFLAMAKDLRVVLIKFADRLHHLRTLEYLPSDQRQRIANETLEIYVPIANLLGIWYLKWQMENICFKYLQPEEYKKLSQKYEVDKKLELDQYIERVSTELEKTLNKLNISYEINSRFKHLYSIWQKMNKKDRQFNEIYDVFALRVIVPSISDCYRTLGAIHSLWKPNTARFKDYIASPKPNGYQSLHTTVFGPENQATEFQIRTPQMHEQAQYGLAAHWNYKEHGGKQLTPKFNWTKKILAIQKNAPNMQDFMQKLQLDIFKNQIFVLTPLGDVYEIPLGSTTIDFAYAVHTEIGNKAKGALINNKIGRLDDVLHNNDIVEIIIDKKQAGPNLAWLKFVTTSKAKKSIRQYALQSALNNFATLKYLRDWWHQHEPKKQNKK